MLLAGFTHGIYVYAAILSLMAFWASFYHPIANSFISKVHKIKVSEALGLHGMGGTMGIVLAPTVAWFLGAYFGWPWAFVFFGMLSVSIAVMFAKKAVHIEDLSHGKITILEALRMREVRTVLVLNVA